MITIIPTKISEAHASNKLRHISLSEMTTNGFCARMEVLQTYMC